jgi:recombination protein RecA
MSALASRLPVVPQELLQQFSSSLLHNAARSSIPTGLASLDSALPDEGFPRGCVSEISAVPCCSQATSIGLRLCASAQKLATLRGGLPAWCAWLDPSCSLFAPGVASYNVALDRLLVVRPPAPELARIAVRVASSRAFAVVVVDTCGVLGAPISVALPRWANVVRRLAIAVADSDCSIVLLTEQAQSRQALLPVALRLLLHQTSASSLRLQVTKDRHGRAVSPQVFSYCAS